jgi:peptidoglycan/LPS O-acetylase OafA/YrhL
VTPVPKRVNELDSVRGIAAFIVVLHHCWEAILPDQNTYPMFGRELAGTGWFADTAYWISVSPLRLLFCGHAAVGVFFVLSGLVLAKSLQDPRQRGYGPFIVRRFFRIYPPFAFVILSSAALCYLLNAQPIPGRDWINLSWSEPVTPALIAGHLLMLVTDGAYNSLDSPMWTLVHELRISIVFPFLAAMAIARPRATLAGALAVFALFSVRHFTSFLDSLIAADLAREIAASFIETARFLLFFVLGILLATRFSVVENFLRRNVWGQWVMWPLALLLLAVPYAKAYTEILYAFGAYGLIALCIYSDTAKKLLRHDALLWLGKVSYSLYLVHQVVLLALVHWLHAALPLGVILLLMLPASLLAAQLMNRLIELPSNQLGKRLAAVFT